MKEAIIMVMEEMKAKANFKIQTIIKKVILKIMI